MHSVIETPDVIADAKSAGITDAERQAIVTLLSGDPRAGRPSAMSCDELAGLAEDDRQGVQRYVERR